MSVRIRRAGRADVRMLAEMNKQLIEDEGSRNPMSLDELERRMAGFLAGAWRADILEYEQEIAGYALYQIRKDEYFPDEEEVYLRQYFVKRHFRGLGIGRKGLELLKRERFPQNGTIVIDVLHTNPGGRKFWERVGFEPYYTNMKLKI